MFKELFRKLFLTKEIISKEGAVHFRRYRLLQTPWFAIYIHNILRSDEDTEPHDHPWNFLSIILSGGYNENVYRRKVNGVSWKQYHNHPGAVIYRSVGQFHKISLMKPTWTLVFTGRRINEPWGYLYLDGHIEDFVTYRKNKRG